MNPWVEHVRKYAATHNISYMCAISHPDCKNSYVKVDPAIAKQKQQDLDTRIMKSVSKNIIEKMNNNIATGKSSFKQTSIEFKKYFKLNRPEEYNKLK